jgi:uncharacterized membrane protein (DUF2068 family)
VKRRRDRIITLIAIFKFVKGLLLVGGGLAALELLRPAAADRVWSWVAQLSWDVERRLLARGLSMVTRSGAGHLHLVAFAAFAYAALFFVEGIGLFLQKRWAEWLTIVATGSLIPIEIYELLHRATAMKIAVLAVNIAVVIYLIVKVRSSDRG